MVDLQKISGLPISLDKEKLDINFEGEFPSVKKSARTLEELKVYLKDPQNLKGPDPAYLVWRQAHLKEDDEEIKKNLMRYDITLLAPGLIGEEFVKTAGHYHAVKPGTGLTFPEVYEVLYGRGYFLIQKMDDGFSQVLEVYLVEAAPGQKVLVPPGFGHVTVNVFDGALAVANWISTDMTYNYEPYERYRGGAYYFTANQSGGIDILPNKNYGKVPEIKKLMAEELPKFDLIKSKPMYELARDLDKLRFLNYPEEFANDIDVKKVYKF